MKPNKYIMTFDYNNESIVTYAQNFNEAIIKILYDRIKNGEGYGCGSIKNIDSGKTVDFNPYAMIDE